MTELPEVLMTQKQYMDFCEAVCDVTGFEFYGFAHQGVYGNMRGYAIDAYGAFHWIMQDSPNFAVGAPDFYDFIAGFLKRSSHWQKPDPVFDPIDTLNRQWLEVSMT